nr:hypothetical protein [uncultured Neisseria sp.]
MNCTPKVARQLTRCSFLWPNIHYTSKYQTVFHYLSEYKDQYRISRTHLRRWITACQESGICALKPFSPKS